MKQKKVLEFKTPRSLREIERSLDFDLDRVTKFQETLQNLLLKYENKRRLR